MLENKVIIWGGDNYNVMGLLRQLANNNIDVFFLIDGKANGCATKSKHCKLYHETLNINSGYEYLLSNCIDLQYKPIIITPSDDIIEFIDQHRNELIKYFIIPGCEKQGLLSKYNNKNNMVELAEKSGFIVPKSKKCTANQLPSAINFPCILKPSHSCYGLKNEFKYKICNNLSNLTSTLKYVRKNSEFILQEYIPKESVALVYGCRLNNGTTITAGTFVKDRFTDNGDGSHGYLTSKYPYGINCKQIEKFLNEIDYHGLFSFEYGLYKGKAYFFEVNLRNDGTSHYFYQSGANIPLAYVVNCAGLDYSQISTKVMMDSWYIDELFDCENIIERNLSFRQWKRDKLKATVFKYYDKDDEGPWQYVMKRRWKQIAQDLILRRFRLYIVYIYDKIGLKIK